MQNHVCTTICDCTINFICVYHWGRGELISSVSPVLLNMEMIHIDNKDDIKLPQCSAWFSYLEEKLLSMNAALKNIW